MVFFAHLADVHIGAWRDPLMSLLPDHYFEEAINVSINRKVDFIIISGDLFHSAIPGLDHVKSTIKSLQKAKNEGIPVYLIPGSHDFSASGKSMIDVLEEAGLVINVFKGSVVNEKLRLEPVVDNKTNTLITGIIGLKGMLEKHIYKNLDYDFLSNKIAGINPDFSVFLFHSSVKELVGDDFMSSQSLAASALPRGFDYYAGGHVHIINDLRINLARSSGNNSGSLIAYPGPVFPANFSELETLLGGNFILFDSRSDNKIERVPIRLKRVVNLRVSADSVSSSELQDLLFSKVENLDSVSDCIVLIRVSGVISSGSVSDINFKAVFEKLYERGAYRVLRNSLALKTKDFVNDNVESSASASEIEDMVFEKYGGKVFFSDDELLIAKRLLRILGSEKNDGETNNSYKDRILEESKALLGVDDKQETNGDVK